MVGSASEKTLLMLVNWYCTDILLKCDSIAPFTVTSNFPDRRSIEESRFSMIHPLYVMGQLRKKACAGYETNSILFNDVVLSSENSLTKPAKLDIVPSCSLIQYTWLLLSFIMFCALALYAV